MSSSTVYNAYKTRLVTELGGTYPVRDWEEIETALQQGSAPWIAIEDSGATDQLDSIGTPDQNWVTDDGYLDFHIFVPAQGGLGPARTVGDLVRDTFRYYRPPTSSGETLRTINVGSPEPGIIHDGLWHSVIVTVTYSHQYAASTAAA